LNAGVFMGPIKLFLKKINRDFAFSAQFISSSRIEIGVNTKILPFSLLNASAGTISIGRNCYLDRNVVISCNGGDIKIGNHCSFNPNCVIYGHGGLVIGDDVRIAAGTVIVPANHGFQNKDEKICNQPLSKKGIKIESNCWLGAGVTVLDGVVIGEGRVIGAASVVTENIPPYSVVAGNPAKLIKMR
jgi:acetyltransferase-like isoleucine patch superfamily enzyme